MRLTPAAPDLVASLDGTTVVMAIPGRISLYSSDGSERASAEIPDGEPDVGFVGQRLIVTIRADDRTHLVALNLPSLELVAQLELEDRLRLCACIGMRALVTDESLEQPRIVTVTSALVVEPIALHQPLVFATAAPEERLLVASRAREQQIECWDPVLRRALFRLNLPLMAKAQFAGFANRRRLLWIAATGEDSFLELYRFSDGRLQARAEMGGSVLGAVGHPESPRLIVAVQPRQGPLELCALDFASGERHELTPPQVPVAICVAESAAPALVLHGGVAGPPLFMPLPRALPPDAEHPAPPVLSRATRTVPSVSTLGRPHAPAPTTPPTPSAHPLRVPLRPVPHPTPARALDEDGDASRDDALAPPLSRAGTWRDQLCEWSAPILANPRRRLELPDQDDASPLADAVERLELDGRTTRALALLYGARLLGEASLPAALLARALGDGAPATEREWDEALGRGALAELGLARAHRGRVALRPLVARFLDGTPPRLTLVPAGDGALATPPGVAVHEAGEATLEQAGATLAARFGCAVALVPLQASPRQAPLPPPSSEAPAPLPSSEAPLLARALLEARLHGAWPLVSGADPAAWLDALRLRPSVILVRGPLPPSLSALPRV